MNVGAKTSVASDAGTSAWDQLAATPNHDHPIRPQQSPPTPMTPVVKQSPSATPDVKPPEYGEELHIELVNLIIDLENSFFLITFRCSGETRMEKVLVEARKPPVLLEQDNKRVAVGNADAE